MGLIIRSSPIHSAGCYATSKIPKGARIVEYTGPRISKERGDEIYEGREDTYLFSVGDGSTVIEGNGMAAFINHSCEPNCEIDEDDERIFIRALRDIEPEEELSYDYNLYDGDEDDPAPCCCGAPTCRGTMYSPEEAEKRRKPPKKRMATSAVRA